ncbi:hypothetical protein KP509_36G050300 [Ceratopteris richardii]|uniref:RRM domain-containing protein n=1 Tax=Ceratopteris richardii TaxID=49495 RepID=A0A8T2QCS9_CERRI|nr:hypothetical protein KP509_36G050300 [Ceratopteris richardii]KAH7281486.1 hypothetical protein KP509_36G050300 [Ceratopteris richardii]
MAQLEDEEMKAATSDEEERADGSDGGREAGYGDNNDEDNDTTSSSSSEYDLLSDEEGETEAAIHKLETSLTQNPYNFQEHVEYIQTLRKSGMLEKLRAAREKMSTIFPLSPDMWKEWTSDEARLISSQEDVAAVCQLFERGLQDYLSIPLWIEYLELKLHHDQDIVESNDEGVTKMRGLYEGALASASLHFLEGTKIWASYRQYELNLLNLKQDLPEELRMKHVNCVRSIFRRQLSVPSCDINTTLRDYIDWESKQGIQIGDDSDDLAGLPANVAASYRKAVQMCALREPLEEKISKEKPKDAELLQNFLSYIALEEETGDPARVQVLYERAVVEFPITHDLWLKYTSYLEKCLKGSPIILSVYTRAIRNCPWSQALWSRRMLAMERSNAGETALAEVFEQALHSGFAFSTPEEYLDLFLTRVDGLRRRLPSKQVDKLSYLGSLRETYKQADEFLSTYFPTFVDRSLKLHSYWARLEYSVANDIVAARGVWEYLIKSSGSMLEAWKGYISMEVSLGNLAEARALYRRCYTRKFEGNGSEVLCEAWLQFEREYGSLEDYDYALLKTTPRLAEVRKLQQMQDAKSLASASRESKEVTNKSAKTITTVLGQKRQDPHDIETIKERKPRKKQKVSTANVGKEPIVHIVSADMEEDKTEDAPAAVARNMDIQVKPESEDKHWYSDQCTAFVSRLAPEVNEDDLYNLFSQCKYLREIRLMRDRKTGVSRRFAYVDFDNEEGLSAALKLNEQKLKGSKIKVLRSDPAVSSKKSVSNSKDQIQVSLPAREEKNDGMRNSGGEIAQKQSSNYGQSQGRGRGRSIAPLVSHRRGGHVQLSGKTTFAVPRSLARPLGFSRRGQTEEVKSDEPKSNEDFRKMLSKG